MSNRFEQAYECLDAKLLTGAENAVQAWNWTTGRTKADLANTLLTIAPCCETSFWFMEYFRNENPYSLGLAIIMGIGSGATSFAKIISNGRLEKREEEALHKGCLDPIVEESRESCKSESETYGSLGTMICIGSLVPGAPGYGGLMGAGLFMRAASGYVMRVSNPPPRKDCISRGIDRLKQGLESLAEKQPRLTYTP